MPDAEAVIDRDGDNVAEVVPDELRVPLIDRVEDAEAVPGVLRVLVSEAEVDWDGVEVTEDEEDCDADAVCEAEAHGSGVAVTMRETNRTALFPVSAWGSDVEARQWSSKS